VAGCATPSSPALLPQGEGRASLSRGKSEGFDDPTKIINYHQRDWGWGREPLPTKLCKNKTPHCYDL